MSDVEAVRQGHQSEVLQSIADEFPPNLCFTLEFRGRQGNLDLVAETPEEAGAWVRGMRKLIHKAKNMDEKERLDQYPSQSLGLQVNRSIMICLCIHSSSPPL